MYRLTVKLIEKSASLIAVEAEIIKYTQNNYPLGQLLYMMYNQKNHNKPIVICFPNYRVSVQPTSKLYKGFELIWEELDAFFKPIKTL